jgi:hypothetical protein
MNEILTLSAHSRTFLAKEVMAKSGFFVNPLPLLLLSRGPE